VDQALGFFDLGVSFVWWAKPSSPLLLFYFVRWTRFFTSLHLYIFALEVRPVDQLCVFLEGPVDQPFSLHISDECSWGERKFV
jgi:hypothetical protein